MLSPSATLRRRSEGSDSLLSLSFMAHRMYSRRSARYLHGLRRFEMVSFARRYGLTVLFALTVAGTLTAQQPATPEQKFTFREVMIAARDGTKLHTTIFTPVNATEKLPIMLVRTPYGVPGKDN